MHVLIILTDLRDSSSSDTSFDLPGRSESSCCIPELEGLMYLFFPSTFNVLFWVLRIVILVLLYCCYNHLQAGLVIMNSIYMS